jgi:small nuclear ribonucleoprotein (snRNP)-like protein
MVNLENKVEFRGILNACDDRLFTVLTCLRSCLKMVPLLLLFYVPLKFYMLKMPHMNHGILAERKEAKFSHHTLFCPVGLEEEKTCSAK